MTPCCLCLEAESDPEISQKEGIPLCKSCAAERDVCRQSVKSPESMNRNPAALCTRCGACCFMLSAGVTEEELRELCEWSGMLPSELARVEKFGKNEGRLVFHRPCVFLMGKPLNYVNCRAYKTKRPQVCEVYLCKVAIQYRMGICSLHEGLFLLREAFTRSDPTLFNWTGADEGESRLMLRSAADAARRKLKEEKYPDPVIDVLLADVILPKYEFISPVQETTFRAILKCAQDDTIDPLLFFDVDEMIKFTSEQMDAVIVTQRTIFHRLRELFKEKEKDDEH